MMWHACSFEDGLQLVKLRGESMQAAADQKPSAMVSVIGLSSEKVPPLLFSPHLDSSPLFACASPFNAMGSAHL